MTGMGVSGQRGNVPVGEGGADCQSLPRSLYLFGVLARTHRAPPCLARGRAATTGATKA